MSALNGDVCLYNFNYCSNVAEFLNLLLQDYNELGINSFVSIVLFCAVFFTTAESRTVVPSFLLKSRSQKNLVQTAEDHQWSINFQKSKADTINIIALRVEFQVDSSMLTTGNGLFGMRGAFRNSYDRKEYSYYTDNTYKYDLLPHDSLYFAHQLQAASEYFRKVSRNKLTIQYSIYPSGRGKCCIPDPEPWWITLRWEENRKPMMSTGNVNLSESCVLFRNQF